MRILLVEDDAMLSEAIARALRQSAHSVQVARNGAEADEILATDRYDLVLLDLGLPKLDGFEVLRRLRQRRSSVPVLILTVRDSLEDLVTGLDLGADDYLTKPFELAALEARVRALLRRANAAQTELVHGRLRLDVAGRRLYCDERPLELSARELGVVELLLLREGRVVTRQQIIDQLYGWEEDSSTRNAIEAFIYRLRKKLESCGVDIRTVRGMGYLIDKRHGG